MPVECFFQALHDRATVWSPAALCCVRCEPNPGDLRFERVSLRYFPGGPLALRGVSFHIRDQEKVRRVALRIFVRARRVMLHRVVA
jgi:ABC-type multidrug transport system fused ATPase/permease subunit